jgi:DNA-binding CsgD family transcriptional regulator/PAS domain-containing protein
VLLRLIDQVYGAAETPELWEPFLVSLAEAVNGRAAVLLQHDLVESGAVNVAVRVDPEAHRQYNHYFNRLDPWAAGARRLGPGIVATDEMLISPQARRTEYFSDFASRFDLTRLLTVVFGRHAGMNVGLSILRGDRDEPFAPHDRHLVAALVPHVQRALAIHQRIAAAQHERAGAFQALDAVRCAVFLVDAEAKVVIANRGGRAMLMANDPLSTEGARLSAARPHETAKLRHLCAAVAGTRREAPGHPGGMLALERPSGGPALQALVAPARSTDPLGLHDDRIAALVFISDPADEQKPSEQLLRELYGLTPAEASVAARIAVGWSLERIAAERGSALETVRRQSKQILAKTGARHRSELVVRLLTLFPGIQG